MTEEWRDIPGYEGLYKISDMGRVEALPPARTKKSHARPDDAARGSYQVVSLTKDGVRHVYRVHSLVMLAFAGRCPEGMEINHINGNKWDNRRVNLEYVTPKENMRHAVEVLGRAIGQAATKMNADTVRAMRQRYASGTPMKVLARYYDVAYGTVLGIVNRKTWKHVKDNADPAEGEIA